MSTYKIKRGDTLSGIASQHGLNYKDVAKWNNISDPNRIQAGATLNLSAPQQQSTAPKAPSQPTSPTSAPKTSSQPNQGGQTTTLLSQINELINKPQKEYETLSYDDARGQAGDQLNPQYDEALQERLKQVDNHNISRGFYGQLPGDALARSNATQVETARESHIGQLAQYLKDRSHDTAMQQRGMDMQEKQANLQNLFSLLGFHTEQEQRAWERDITERKFDHQKRQDSFSNMLQEAQLTGRYKGNPTLAYRQFLHNQGMDKRQIALAEKQANASISQGWARIQDARNQADNALKAQLDMSRQEFDSQIMMDAGRLTDQFLSRAPELQYMYGPGTDFKDYTQLYDSVFQVSAYRLANGQAVGYQDIMGQFTGPTRSGGGAGTAGNYHTSR